MATVRKPTCIVRIDGTYTYTTPISVSWTYNLKQPVAQATVVLAGAAQVVAGTAGSLPVTYWSHIEIGLADEFGGTLPGGGYGWISGWQKRFDGYVIGVTRTLFPNTTTLLCAGRLKKAEIITCNDLTMLPFASDEEFGTDLAGRTDITMIAHVLTQCDLGSSFSLGTGGSLGGLNRQLGIDADDQFAWRYGESGWDFIQRLDQLCLGFRTFDTPDLILRAQIRARPDYANPAAATFQEHVDIERGETNEDPAAARNLVRVSGLDDGLGAGPIRYAVRQRSIYLPGLVGYITEQLSSGMIEHEDNAAATAAGWGLSCEEIARWLLDEYNRLFVRVQFTTPRMDRIDVGQSIDVLSPLRMAVARRFWVQAVTCTLDGNSFKQTFDCVDALPSIGVIEDSATSAALNVDGLITRLTANMDAVTATASVYSSTNWGVAPFAIGVENDAPQTVSGSPTPAKYERMTVTALGGTANTDWTVTRATTPLSAITTHAAGRAVVYRGPTEAPITPTTAYSDTTAKIDYAAPDGPPGWYSTTLDDTTWANAVAAANDATVEGPPVAGSTPVWVTNRPAPYDDVVLRQSIAIPSGAVATATLTIAVGNDSDLLEVYFNNHRLNETPLPGGTTVIPLDVGAVGVGGTNVVAIHARYAYPVASPNDYAWISFKLEVA